MGVVGVGVGVVGVGWRGTHPAMWRCGLPGFPGGLVALGPAPFS